MTGSGTRILLTGGSGFIGARMRAHLSKAGYAVDAPTRRVLDLEDRIAATRYIAALEPTVVIHLASPAMSQAREAEAATIRREISVTQILTAAVPDTCRLLHAGSMAEYGYSGRHAEDARFTPVTAYGRAKLAANRAMREIATRRAIDATVVRIFGAYGPGESARRLFSYVLRAAHNRDPIALSDGTQLRDFIHVDDVCAALMRLVVLPTPFQESYNIGTGSAVSVRSAVERISREAEIDPARLGFGAIPRSSLDEDCLEADASRLTETLGWCPPQRFLAAEPLLPLLGCGALSVAPT